MKKSGMTFFLMPGFKQKSRDTQFVWLIKFLKKQGFKVIVVPIKWKNRTISDYVKDFKEFYGKHKTTTNYVLGFSYGAVITLITANELKPKRIYLCSLSPDFKEDIIKMKPWVRKLVGKRRLQDAKKRSGKEMAKGLKIPSVIFYGESEGRVYPQLKVRCEETVKLANDSKLIVVKSASHRLNHFEYMKSLKQELRRIP